MQPLLKEKAMGGIDPSSMTVCAKVERVKRWRGSSGLVLRMQFGKDDCKDLFDTTIIPFRDPSRLHSQSLLLQFTA
jgi:hypothetical protein